jgi:hypothetical protein
VNWHRARLLCRRRPPPTPPPCFFHCSLSGTGPPRALGRRRGRACRQHRAATGGARGAWTRPTARGRGQRGCQPSMCSSCPPNQEVILIPCHTPRTAVPFDLRQGKRVGVEAALASGLTHLRQIWTSITVHLMWILCLCCYCLQSCDPRQTHLIKHRIVDLISTPQERNQHDENRQMINGLPTSCKNGILCFLYGNYGRQGASLNFFFYAKLLHILFYERGREGGSS